jgi:hypothetical protein
MEVYKAEKVRDSAKVSSAEVRLPRGLEGRQQAGKSDSSEADTIT